MYKAIIMSEKEFDELKRSLVTELIRHSNKSFGFKMIARDGGHEITNEMEMRGTFSHPIERVFSRALGEVMK